MGRPTHDDEWRVTPEDVKQTLAALEQNRPDLIDSAILESLDPRLCEKGGDIASAEPDEQLDPDTTVVRDAFGNRQRVARTDLGAKAPKDLKVLIEMYSLPKDLSRLVLLGKMDFATARAIQKRRKPAGKDSGLPMRVRVILGLAAVAALLLLVRLL